MAAFPHKYRTILLSALLCLLPAAVFGAGQQPGEDGPPLQDESALPDSEVPALKHDITEPFIKPGEEAVLDNRLPAQDQMDVIDGEDLRPGQEPTFNEQMPGYESEAARMLDDPTPPSYNSKAPEDSQQTEEPLSRRERRKLRKEAKNTPLALPELSKDAYRISGGKKARPMRIPKSSYPPIRC